MIMERSEYKANVTLEANSVELKRRVEPLDRLEAIKVEMLGRKKEKRVKWIKARLIASLCGVIAGCAVLAVIKLI